MSSAPQKVQVFGRSGILSLALNEPTSWLENSGQRGPHLVELVGGVLPAAGQSRDRPPGPRTLRANPQRLHRILYQGRVCSGRSPSTWSYLPPQPTGRDLHGGRLSPGTNVHWRNRLSASADEKISVMYRPAANVVDEETGWQLLADTRAGHLVTAAEGALDATFLPYIVDAKRGRVLAHFARANPQWRSAAGAHAMLIATGADAYVSPSSYATKRQTGKVVPTWNYTVVHAYGVLHVHDDIEWLRQLVDRLTNLHERTLDTPWAITDAPAEYIERNLKAIVGVELVVDRLEAKRKLSQNRSAEDFAGVLEGLRHGDVNERATAEDMAGLDRSASGA